MRLIDTDKLSPTDKVVTVKSTGEKCVYQRTDNAPTVEAIPIEWIEKFMNRFRLGMVTSDEYALLHFMLTEWEEENE